MPPTRTTRCRDAPVVARAVAWLVVLCLSALATEAGAKTPGGVHCYGAVCHRVKSLAEIGRLVGSSSVLLTSYYDDPSRDRFTAGHVTSSGETFNAASPAHAANGGPGSIYYFSPLRVLVVRQTDEIHGTLSGLIEGLRD